MTATERENFELVLEFHDELRTHVARLCDVASSLALTVASPTKALSAELKARIFANLGTQPRKTEPDALVVTNPAGQVEWVSQAFTDMCGFTLKELKGRTPGHLLQGEATDRAAVQRIRSALRHKHACQESLLNYHKDGSDYRVDIRITPILDEENQVLWFIAKERKLPDVEVVGSA